MPDIAGMLEKYDASGEEAAFKPRFFALLASAPACLMRNFFNPGHITGSALLLSADGKRVLLNHHRSLNKWLCFGGHADGDADILAVARRELEEESGIIDAQVLPGGIHDLDIHPIPENPKKGEPAHLHYDVRFVFKAGREDFTLSDESHALKWCSFDEALELAADASMRRLISKARVMAG